jgi:hypothetical protein
VYFVEKGTVEIVTVDIAKRDMQLTLERNMTGTISPNDLPQQTSRKSSQLEVIRVNKACQGGVFGEADFILGKNRR